MKVLQPATGPTPLKHECSTCHAVLEISVSDCTHTGDQRDGDFWSCNCPVCKTRITLDAGMMLREYGWNYRIHSPNPRTHTYVGRD